MSQGFAEVIARKLIGKFVEIYQGDEHYQHNYADYNTEVKTVLTGKLVEVDGECFVVEVVGEDGAVGSVYINSWSIKAICLPKEGITTQEAFRAATKVSQGIKRDKHHKLNKKVKNK